MCVSLMQKENNCFEKMYFLEVVKVCFVCAFEKHSITIEKNQPLFKIKENNCFEEGKTLECVKV